MLTKSDYQKAIADSINNYPAIAPLYLAGDPRITQNLDAMATMLAMFSGQQETAQAEPFEKVRDATVLSDLAMRGVIRKALPGRVRITVANDNATAITIDAGRVVFDSVGNPYVVETSVTVAANGTGTCEAVQVSYETLTHTVSGSAPFYPIEIPEASNGSYLSGIAVSDASGSYEYRERYVNTWPDERIFHVEVDDRQRVYVRFGQAGIVGTQPADGLLITVTISRTFGEISPASGSPFSLEYLLSPAESSVALTMNALLDTGENPPDMAVLRDLTKYPSVYDHSAVFLGEFDFVVRRSYPTVKFLSVWNEAVEEVARGASVDNINTLFVAVLSSDNTEAVLTEPNPASPVAPTTILPANYTATQKGIKSVILTADNSYRVRFLTPVRSEVAVTVAATVSTSYVANDVRLKIIDVLLEAYGEAAGASKRGSNNPLYRSIYALIKEKIPALSDGNADIKLTIAEPAGAFRPELWRYISASSLTVTVSTANITIPSWGL